MYLIYALVVLIVLIVMWCYHKMHNKSEKFYPESDVDLTVNRPRAPHLVVPDCTTDINVQIPESDRGLATIGPYQEGPTENVQWTEHADDLLYREWLI